jgi:hypothetical protein
MPRRHSAIIIIIAALGLIGLPFAGAANFTKGRNVKPFTPDLKPGDYRDSTFLLFRQNSNIPSSCRTKQLTPVLMAE